MPLAEFNRTVAGMAKPGGMVQSPGIQAVAKSSTLLADVPASSNAPHMAQGPAPPMDAQMQTRPVSTATTNPETSQGINRMRLAHERGDPIPTVAQAKMQMAKAAIFRSRPTGVLDPQSVAKAIGNCNSGGRTRSCIHSWTGLGLAQNPENSGCSQSFPSLKLTNCHSKLMVGR